VCFLAVSAGVLNERLDIKTPKNSLTFTFNVYDWLVGYLTARHHKKVNLCQLQGGKLAKLAKDGHEIQCILPYVTR